LARLAYSTETMGLTNGLQLWPSSVHPSPADVRYTDNEAIARSPKAAERNRTACQIQQLANLVSPKAGITIGQLMESA
jgi:hypothetical protein